MLLEAEFRYHVSVWRKFVSKLLIKLLKVSQVPITSLSIEDDGTAVIDDQSVSLLNPIESDIRPNQAEIQGNTQAISDESLLQGQEEFWWVLALLALGILSWEWYVYWRGGGA